MDKVETSLRILGLGTGATLEEINQSYRDLAKVWHPDRFPNDSRLRWKGEETLKKINEAYEILQGCNPASGVRVDPSSSRSECSRQTQGRERGQKEYARYSPPNAPDTSAPQAARPPIHVKALAWPAIQFGFASLFLFGLWLQRAELVELARNGKQTVGIVVDNYTVVYDGYTKPFALGRQFPVGSQLHVLYLPTQPNVAHVTETLGSAWAAGSVLAIAFLGFWGYSVYYLAKAFR